MLLTIAHIGQKSGKSGAKSNYDALTRMYLDRIVPYIPCQGEVFASEAAFLTWLSHPRQSGRTAAFPVLLDSRGRQFSSTELAAWLGARRDQGLQQIVFAIGPADGWSQTALDAAKSGLLLSFGAITMAHELARLVLAEQLYRACTILSGHPYHSGH
jgi:23S rRNA (pseudouridine1915-N3)-methyltransferase